jgi:parvulin-like peptidyl-prolyl isomerase
MTKNHHTRTPDHCRFSRSLFYACILLMLAGLAHAEDEVIARAGSVEVKTSDVTSSLGHLTKDERLALAADKETLTQLVRSLAAQRLILNEAASKNWEKKPDIAAQLERTRESAIAETYLQSVSRPPDSYPAEADIKEAYETNRAAFFIPKSYRLAQIYIDDKPDAKAAEKKLSELETALKEPNADFDKVARQYSQEPNSAARGGELGWLAESQIQPEIRAQLPDLKLGAVSASFKLNDGWHILRVMDIKEASTLTLDQARASIIQQLRSAKTKANSDAYMAGLLSSNPVAINELALPKALGEK